MRYIRRLDGFRRAALATTAVGAMVGLVACGSRAAAGHPGPPDQSSSGGQTSAAGHSASATRSASAHGSGAALAQDGGPNTGVALCTGIPQLTSVVVSRTAAFREAQPRAITIVNRGRVRGLAAALCGLPPLARGALSCAAHVGGGAGSVRFAFADSLLAFAPVTVQANGCRLVSGLGPVRTAQSAVFWQLLAVDLGGPAVPSGPA